MDQYKEQGTGTDNKNVCKENERIRIIVSKATISDVSGIFKVAASVGKSRKVSEKGFLMDNYNENPKFYKEKFKKWVENLDYMYVAKQDNKIIGFLMAYTRREWLKENESWVEDISWKPGFLIEAIEDFVVIDKTAVMYGHTGKGIGSILYKALMKDLTSKGIEHIFSETLIDPVPNFASLAFRKKQSYKLVGTRYESYKNKMYTDLIYYKQVKTTIRNYPQYILNTKQQMEYNN